MFANVHGSTHNLTVGSTSAGGASENLVHFACKHHVTSPFSNSRGVQVLSLHPPAGSHDIDALVSTLNPVGVSHGAMFMYVVKG